MIMSSACLFLRCICGRYCALRTPRHSERSCVGVTTHGERLLLPLRYFNVLDIVFARNRYRVSAFITVFTMHVIMVVFMMLMILVIMTLVIMTLVIMTLVIMTLVIMLLVI